MLELRARTNAAVPRSLAVLALAFAATTALARPHAHAGQAAGRFDYYVMALSWSPSYCATHENQREECSKGYGFVLHGLWPEFRGGGWQSDCGDGAGPDAATIDRALAFMPSRGLIAHEWQTHGSCTGLDARDYFALADRAFATVVVPPALRTPQRPPALSADDIVAAFGTANPGMEASMLSVQCRNGAELVEVRVCLNRDTLTPQPCSGRVRNTCRYGALKIPAAR